MSRTSLILGVVALGLLAFIVIFERGTVSTGEREKRQGRLLETFVRDKIVQLTVQRKGVTTVLTRKPAPEEGLELGAWQVEAPFVAKADKDAVESLIGELEWTEARRTLHDVSASDLVKFGLDKPRYRVSFLVGREQGSLSVGKETPEGGSLYVQTGDPKTAYVVGKDLVAALDHDAAHFHTKELHATTFTVFGARRITLRDDKGERVVEKRGDYLWLVRPTLRLASEPVVNALVTDLDGLQAQRYIASGAGNVADYGLDAPRFEARLESETYGENPKPGDQPRKEKLLLRVGKPCSGHQGESYVRADDGPVMCASDADIAKLEQPESALGDTRLLAIDASQVRGVRVQSGTRELVLSQQGEGFRYKILEQGRDKSSGEAAEGSVGDWLSAMQAMTAEEISGAPPPKVTGSVVGEATVVTFERGKDKAPYRIVFGESEGRVAVGRIDEPVTLLFPIRARELIEVASARFRKRTLLDEKEAEFQSLALTRAGGVRESVSRDAAGAYTWKLPLSAPGERSTVDELVRLFSKLEAVRFVADAPTAAQGLSSPEYVLEMRYAGSAGNARVHTLRIGAPTEAGRYAQLDGDPAVFVAADVLVSQLREPLVSRAALATPIEHLASLRVEHGGKVVEVVRKGDAFSLLGSNDASAERAQALAQAIATLRVVRVLDYGAKGEGEGTDRPTARIVVSETTDATAKHTLLVGNPVSTDANADVYVRRSDLPLGFTLSRAAVDELLGQSPSAASPAAPAP